MVVIVVVVMVFSSPQEKCLVDLRDGLCFGGLGVRMGKGRGWVELGLAWRLGGLASIGELN